MSAQATPLYTTAAVNTPPDYKTLRRLLDGWAQQLGFAELAVTDTDLGDYSPRLRRWLALRRHGDMGYMERNSELREHPQRLLPGTVRVISVRMDYLHRDAARPLPVLRDSGRAYIARYALGRDYHKLMRRRLAVLAGRIRTWLQQADAPGSPRQRPFVDSAPVQEKPLAEKAGLGWIGKNTLLLSRRAGSWFFLGEIFTSAPLPVDNPAARQQGDCRNCRACMTACPTGAIVAPYQLDARRCIAYLTIEHKGAIPVELRAPMGNRVFGCDDCQLCCPWNRHARPVDERDFRPRHGLDDSALLELFKWTQSEFLERTAGSPIRRLGYQRWRRNLSVGIGNGRPSAAAIAALREAQKGASQMLAEHLRWAEQRLLAAH